ncbi:MAG TPA: carbohydrate porin, partial [Terriglobales bacterium]
MSSATRRKTRMLHHWRAFGLALVLALLPGVSRWAQVEARPENLDLSAAGQTDTGSDGSGAASLPAAPALEASERQPQTWNFHTQSTMIVQAYPSFSAAYSGPNSLPTSSQGRETVSLDLYGGFRLWSGAELHYDLLSWQGFGLAGTLGIDEFSNGEAYKIGTAAPRANIARFFIRQTVGLGGGQSFVPDDQLTLAGKQDVSRLTFTIGRFSSKDMFDNNAYANDPRTQFMNWALMAN